MMIDPELDLVLQRDLPIPARCRVASLDRARPAQAVVHATAVANDGRRA